MIVQLVIVIRQAGRRKNADFIAQQARQCTESGLAPSDDVKNRFSRGAFGFRFPNPTGFLGSGCRRSAGGHGGADGIGNADVGAGTGRDL
jgi:hypothetical protein